MTRGIYVPLEGGESQIAQWVLFWAIWDTPPSWTYHTRHQTSRVQCHFELDTSRGQRFRAAILAGQLTSSAEPGGFALLPGDASVDSGFREIPVPRTWRVYLATGFDFREKNRACFGSIGVPTLASVSYLVTILWRKVNGDHFSRNFVYVLKTTTAHHMVSFIDFYFHFLENLQT